MPSDARILRSTDGTEIFAEATGNPNNPHLVLLAGLNLCGAVYDDLCADQRLLQSLYIVRYDVRGHGRSARPTTAEAYESNLFADDFKTVMEAFKLHKPVFAGWSMGGAVATDIATHLPPGTISGYISLAGVPASGEIVSQMAAPDLIAAFPGLLSKDSVSDFQTASEIFTDKLFSKPESVPYAVKAMYRGNAHALTPQICELSLGRKMEVEKLWEAGNEGLPLFVIQGTNDGHRVGGILVDEIMKPHFKNFEMVWLEGVGHAVHYERPDEVIKSMIDFTTRVYGKDYRSA